MADTLLLSVADGIATLTINRPEIHNAFDDQLIAEMTARYQALDADASVRAVVLAAREAMANAAKFSGADAISVYAEADDARVSVFVRDRGVGFDLDETIARVMSTTPRTNWPQ